MRVLVTDGNNRAALAITRSLGRAGHEVIVAEKYATSLAQASRYCASRMTYPDPVVASDEWVRCVADAVHDRKVDVLLPVSDITTFLVTRQRALFGGACSVPFAHADVVERVADKVDMVRTAERLGLPVPRSIVVTGPAWIPDISFGFPVVVKPWRSRIRTASGWRSTAVSYAENYDTLLRNLASRADYEFPVLIQERIVGEGTGVFACYHEGRPVALFGHRRIRERPPWGGVSVLCESTSIDASALETATRLLDNVGWRGVGMVEFKKDIRDGQSKLMEINGRFWGSLQLAIDAGVDFPAILISTARPGPLPAPPRYRIGIRSRWFWGDVDSLLLTLRGLPGAPDRTHVKRLKAVAQFARAVDRNLYYDNPKWDDPWPWVSETKARLESALGFRS